MSLEFQPLYYTSKVRQVGVGEDFDKEKINVVNPLGRAGIVTLWSKPWDVWNNLRNRFPALFEHNSPLVTLTSLYGNGLPQMLANLAHNPQIQFLAVTGNDVKAVPSFIYLENFLTQGVEPPSEGSEMGKIRGTQYPLDPKLAPEIFRHLKVRRFQPSDLENLVEFISQPPEREATETDRVKIELVEPVFKDYPSNTMNHNVVAETPLKAWMEVIYLIDRFGVNIQLGKGMRRALFNFDVSVSNPSPESPEELAKFNLDWNELQKYREGILEGKLPPGIAYNYGNRMREYFRADTLALIIDRLKKDPLDRRGFLTTWDNAADISSPKSSDSSVPCLTDIYLFKHDERLHLTAGFRTHSAVSGWFTNLYGLRAIQEYIASQTDIEPGSINVRSRWIGIDPNDGKTNALLANVAKYRRTKIDVNDPRGYFIVSTEGPEIVMEHYTPDAKRLKVYRSDSALEIKNQLRQDSAVSDPDHAVWIGMQLGALHYKLTGKIPE